MAVYIEWFLSVGPSSTIFISNRGGWYLRRHFNHQIRRLV